MCGIVGMAGNLQYSHNKFFRDLLIFDTIRGWHSTGVYSIGLLKDSTHLEKCIGPPPNLWSKEAKSDLFSSKGLMSGIKKVVIGHNRAATIGKHTIENAHPFEFDKIVGVHNGTLYSYSDLKGYREHDVDSKALFDNLNEEGIEETWKKFGGAAAIVYWDKEKETLNFARNSQRPLQYIFSPNKDIIYWASEASMIQVAAYKHDIPLERNKEGKVIMREFSTNHNYEFKVTSRSVELKQKTKLEPKEITKSYGSAYYGDWYNKYYDKGWNKGKRTHFKGYTTDRFIKDVNQRWARDTKKADKELRGQEFMVNIYAARTDTLRGREEYFRCRFIDKKFEQDLEIFPRSQADFQMLNRALQGNRPMVLTSRPRLVLDIHGKPIKYKAGSESTGPVKEKKGEVVHLKDLFKKDEKEDRKRPLAYTIFQGERVTELLWENALKEAGSCCYACNNPIQKEQAEELLWVSPKAVLCEECKKDEEIVGMIYGFGV